MIFDNAIEVYIKTCYNQGMRSIENVAFVLNSNSLFRRTT